MVPQNISIENHKAVVFKVFPLIGQKDVNQPQASLCTLPVTLIYCVNGKITISSLSS